MEVQLGNLVRWNFIIPYWTSDAATAITAFDRERLTAQLQQHLNSQPDAVLNWKRIVMSHPPSIARRKGILLRADMPVVDDIVDSILERLRPERLRILSRNWSIEYFDLGLGTIELDIMLDIAHVSFDDLVAFLAEAKEKIIAVGRIKPSSLFTDLRFDELEAFKLWPKIDGAFAKAFRALKIGRENWLLNDRPDFWSGRLSAQNANLFFFSVEEGGVKTSERALADLVCAYTGDLAEPEALRTGNKHAPYIYCTNSGAVAVVQDQYSLDRIHRLWQGIIRYWGALWDSAEGAYRKTMTFKSSESRSRVHTELRNIEQSRQVLSQLIYESRPESMTSDSFELTAYKRFWHAWASDDLLRTVQEQTDNLSNRLSELNNYVNQQLAARINLLVLLFTLVTVAGVSAQVTSFYDFDNSVFKDHGLRIELLALVMIPIALASAFFLGFNLRRGRR